MRLLDADELDKAILSPESWLELRSDSDIVFSEADFSGLHLVNLDLSELDLERCNFVECTIQNCKFSRCNMYAAEFKYSTISHSDFSGSVLTNSNFDEAEISGSVFTGSEVTGSTFRDTSFDNCELSRSRGLAQYYIDQAVGDTKTSIPQSLDFPEHWLLTDEEKSEVEWKRKLSAYRGDDILFCNFDGLRLDVVEVRERDRDEVRQALEHLQDLVVSAVEAKLLHNDCPSVHNALNDYHICLTANAGDGKPRWRKQLHELEQVKVGLGGSNLMSQTEALRHEVERAFPDKIAKLDHIISTHLLVVSGLDRWRSFVQSAGEANMNDAEISNISEQAKPIIEILEGLPEEVDIKVPETIRILRKLISNPIETARLGAYGIVRCVESVFSSIFVYVRKLIVEFGDEILKQVPKPTVRVIVTGLLAAGVFSLFSFFPHLSIWITGGISTLKGLGVIP